MNKMFELQMDDKGLVISSVKPHSGHLEITVDYDDVWHAQVMKEAKRLVKLMNKNSKALTAL